MRNVISGILVSALVSAAAIPAGAYAASPPPAQRAAVSSVESIFRLEHAVLEETAVLQGNAKQLASILKAMPASAQKRVDWEQVKLVEANALRAIAQAKRDASLPFGLRRQKNVAGALREDTLHLRLDDAVLVASNRAVLQMTREVQSGAQGAASGAAPSGTAQSSGAPAGSSTPQTPAPQGTSTEQ